MAVTTAVKRASRTTTKRGPRAHRVSPLSCAHHWLIAAPNGPTSAGTCKNCGTTRDFPNSSEESIWDGAEGRSRWNDMGRSRRRRRGDEEPVLEENVVSV